MQQIRPSTSTPRTSARIQKERYSQSDDDPFESRPIKKMTSSPHLWLKKKRTKTKLTNCGTIYIFPSACPVIAESHDLTVISQTINHLRLVVANQPYRARATCKGKRRPNKGWTTQNKTRKYQVKYSLEGHFLGIKTLLIEHQDEMKEFWLYDKWNYLTDPQEWVEISIFVSVIPEHSDNPLKWKMISETNRNLFIAKMNWKLISVTDCQ